MSATALAMLLWIAISTRYLPGCANTDPKEGPMLAPQRDLDSHGERHILNQFGPRPP